MTDTTDVVDPKPLVPSTVALAERLGANMHRSRLFAGIANAEGAQAVILAGAELGIGPIASLTGIHLIKGKVALSANLMAALIRRSEDYDYRITEHTDQACTIDFTRRGQPVGTSRFTWQDAERAKLTRGDNWQGYPRAMLFARAMSQGAHWHCPDLFAGALYTPEELGGSMSENGEVVAAEWKATPVEAPPPVPVKPPTPQVTLDELLHVYTPEEVMAAAGGTIPTREEACIAVAAALILHHSEDAEATAVLDELARWPATHAASPAHPTQLDWLARLGDGMVPDGLTRARAAVEIGRALKQAEGKAAKKAGKS